MYMFKDSDASKIVEVGVSTIPTTLPLTKIEYSQDLKFIIPKAPTYPVNTSILSIASLVFMTIAATIMMLHLTNSGINVEPILSFFGVAGITTGLASWAWIPFAFTIFGAGLGAIFELYLLLTGTPFQQTRSSATTFVMNIRLLNLAPVALTIFFAVSCMVITDASLRLGALYFAGFVGFGLAFALFFGGAPNAVLLTLIGLQALQIILVLVNSAPPGGMIVSVLLIGQAILQVIAFIITTQTPLKSTAFHVTSTFSGICLFAAMAVIHSAQPNFSYVVAPWLSVNSLLFWGLVATCIAGLVAICKNFPATYNNWRTSFTNAIWTPTYFLLVSAKTFPKPYNLSKVYDKTPPQAITLRPYYIQHSEFLPVALQIPSAEKLDGNVNVFAQLVTQARKTFAVMAILDHFLPQTKISTPLDQKPRMEVWSDGTKYWPTMFEKTIFGYSVPGQTLAQAPQTAINTYKNGQLLAYLAESGVAAPLLKAAPATHAGMLMLDLRDLEQYGTKPDYMAYGGVAYFRINKDAKRLELVSVVAPFSDEEVEANPIDPVFRQIEDLIVASMYFKVISGKHLGEIHMTYNLVEVSLHNAFDANNQWTHPIRTALYLHLFSHELAEEITTEHLVQKGAIFNQIFATDFDSLVQFLNDTYTNFEYGIDENFEHRTKLFSLNNDSNSNTAEILPTACIKWELEYAKIWRRYAEKIVNGVYADDAAVASDIYLQCFHQNLLKILVLGLPERYEGFATKNGLIRYMVDTIHHLVIRHQVYGTTGVRAVMDPRLSKVQIPKDMGTSGVDEWRSLAFVALATGSARFTLLMDDFTYLLEGVDAKYQSAMRDAFNTLQEDLRTLEKEWNSTPEAQNFNEQYFRAIPSSLHTGPGY